MPAETLEVAFLELAFRGDLNVALKSAKPDLQALGWFKLKGVQRILWHCTLYIIGPFGNSYCVNIAILFVKYLS